MNARFLISHKYKLLGWFLFITGIVFGVVMLINDFDYFNLEVPVFPLIGETGIFSKNPSLQWSFNNVSDEIVAIILIIGGIIVAFSKTKDEDEYISKIRMESLIWATYVNYFILVLAILFVYDLSFFTVLILNMFTVLLFFILRFHFILYKTKRAATNEE